MCRIHLISVRLPVGASENAHFYFKEFAVNWNGKNLNRYRILYLIPPSARSSAELPQLLYYSTIGAGIFSDRRGLHSPRLSYYYCYQVDNRVRHTEENQPLR